MSSPAHPFADALSECSPRSIPEVPGTGTARSHPAPAARKEPRFHPYTVEELPAESALPFLITGVLPANALTEIHGSPGSGKSFMALAMALSIATGLPFFGHEAVRANVLYVAAERFVGLRRRIEAWCRRHGVVDRSFFRIFRDGVQLIDARDVRSFITAVEELPEMPALIVLDTLSRCLVGADENGQRDMTRVVDSLDAIRKATGATVLLVHHTRKAGDTERGSTVLRGAVDLMMGLVKAKGHIALSVAKVNDFSPFGELRLRLEAEGSSCVPVQADDAVPDEDDADPMGEFLRGDNRALLEALKAYPAGATQKQLAAETRIPTSTAGRRINAKLVPAGLVTKDKRDGSCKLTDMGWRLLG